MKIKRGERMNNKKSTISRRIEEAPVLKAEPLPLMHIKIAVLATDALSADIEFLVIKYAQKLYGLDELVAKKFIEDGKTISMPKPWGFCLENSPKSIAAKNILIVGVPPLRDFGYAEIRRFGKSILSALAGSSPETKHIGITLHGPGYGLDEMEAFEAEIAGLLDAIRSGDFPISLEKISIIERNIGRANRLKAALDDLIPDGTIDFSGVVTTSTAPEAADRLNKAGYTSSTKNHVFVAMPFKEDMEDVYHYGIQSAVRSSGLICERADLSAFTGDVLDWVRSRIRSSSLVIADLTDANPNVYLEVGFAWGAGIRTILLVKDVAHLKFDLRGQRCLTYRKIKDLENTLTEELRAFIRTTELP
jgi:hypothetical protein